MNAFPQLKTGRAILVATVLAIPGVVAVLYFVALGAWQVSALFQTGAWVPLPVSLLFAEHSLLAAGKAAPVLPLIPELPWLPARQSPRF